MIAWIARVLLAAGGVIAEYFVTRDAIRYPVVSFVVAVFIFIACVSLFAYEDTIMLWAKRFFKKH